MSHPQEDRPSSESEFTFIPLGAIIQEFRVAGTNIVQGFPTEDLYRKYNTPYFGATIGRTCNRIKDGVIRSLNGGQEYPLTTKQGPNSLHGGRHGWDSRTFEGPRPVSRNGKETLEFRYLSRDGEEGYPGTVEVRVWYSAGKEDEDGEGQGEKEEGEKGKKKTVLEMEYEVEFVGDECDETAVSVTNHSYFNLGNRPTIEGTEALLATDKYLPIDSTGIPLGTIEHYTATEVNKSFYINETYPDIDDCFVVDSDPASIPIDTRSRPLVLLASFRHLVTNLRLEVFSTEPAFQFYTGKGINVPAVGGMPARGARAAFCVEPSRYVNAPNEPAWRGMTTLKRGEVWGSKTVYKAWKE